MDILTNIFTTTNKKLTKNDILLIDIPFPPEEIQQHIIKQFEHNNRKIEILEIEIKQLKSTNIPKQILTIFLYFLLVNDLYIFTFVTTAMKQRICINITSFIFISIILLKLKIFLIVHISTF
jgi:hypothetical protein